MPADELPGIPGLLQRAASKWASGDRTESINLYDEASALARDAGDSAKEAEIELGKGFALLQLKDPDSMALAQTCLEKTKAIATASGNEAQVKFVQMIIDTNGMIETEHPGGCSDEGSKPKPCDGGDDLVAKLATVLALHADPGSPWSAQLDAALVKFVAEHGATDWAAATAALNHELARVDSELCGVDGAGAGAGGGQPLTAVAVEPLTAVAVEQRWALLIPTLKEEFADQEKERSCGHSCGSCPTRPACQLHDALETTDDIEDMLLFRAPPPIPAK